MQCIYTVLHELILRARDLHETLLGSRDGKSIGPWDHWSQKKNLIPRKYYPRKNKIVIIYEWINV